MMRLAKVLQEELCLAATTPSETDRAARLADKSVEALMMLRSRWSLETDAKHEIVSD